MQIARQVLRGGEDNTKEAIVEESDIFEKSLGKEETMVEICGGEKNSGGADRRTEETRKEVKNFEKSNVSLLEVGEYWQQFTFEPEDLDGGRGEFNTSAGEQGEQKFVGDKILSGNML